MLVDKIKHKIEQLTHKVEMMKKQDVKYLDNFLNK